MIKIPLNLNISDKYTDEEIIRRFKPRINIESNSDINSIISVNGRVSKVGKRRRKNVNKTPSKPTKPDSSDSSSLSPPPGLPTHSSLIKNDTIAKYWEEYASEQSLDKIYLSQHIIPLYKTFFGKVSLENATNRRIHMIYRHDAIVLLVEPTSSTLNVARIIDFDSIQAIKIRESKGKEPMFAFKLKHDSVLAVYLKQFNFHSNTDWITLFPDSRHSLFLPDYESKMVFNLKFLAKKSRLSLDKLSDEDVVKMYQSCIE
ncbi:hypothetical protein E3P99_03158 [Wallemia hederae]|uniref:Uncharacterized protein n=1 Tax=Wallemia hederae TaxID=1540922 RepID=A0A4T0FGY9_9BASI|nr:hypothetical protein E3P99_03158 [Wallemia hederae]